MSGGKGRKVRISAHLSVNPANVTSVKIRPNHEFGDHKPRVMLTLKTGKKLTLEPWLTRDDVIDILHGEIEYSVLKRASL